MTASYLSLFQGEIFIIQHYLSIQQVFFYHSIFIHSLSKYFFYHSIFIHSFSKYFLCIQRTALLAVRWHDILIMTLPQEVRKAAWGRCGTANWWCAHKRKRRRSHREAKQRENPQELRWTKKFHVRMGGMLALSLFLSIFVAIQRQPQSNLKSNRAVAR